MQGEMPSVMSADRVTCHRCSFQKRSSKCQPKHWLDVAEPYGDNRNKLHPAHLGQERQEPDPLSPWLLLCQGQVAISL